MGNRDLCNARLRRFKFEVTVATIDPDFDPVSAEDEMQLTLDKDFFNAAVVNVKWIAKGTAKAKGGKKKKA